MNYDYRISRSATALHSFLERYTDCEMEAGPEWWYVTSPHAGDEAAAEA